MSRRARLLLTATIFGLDIAAANAADRIRIATQRTGTFAWELDVMRAERLDAAAGIELAITELAAPEAGKIALKSGTVDIIVSDWLWVSRERGLGGRLAFHPFASMLGAVMVKRDSGIKELADLKGKRLAVAGGALDKSWLLLQGHARRSGLDLKAAASIVYGAPPLLSQKALQGEHDATLTFWNFAADLEVRGLVRVIDIADIQRELGAKGAVAILGYVFDGAWAERNRAALTRFLSAARQAKEALAGNDARADAHWSRLAPRIGAVGTETLVIYKARYSEGIPRRKLEDEEADARVLYGVLAETGGRDLVGSSPELAQGTFWRPMSGG